ITINEDAPRTLTAADFGFSDVDGGSMAAVKITTTPGAGSLTYNGAAVSSDALISVADLGLGKLIYTPAANANGAGYASFTFRVQDDGGTGNHGLDLDTTPNTLTFNVTAVNDAPVLGGLTGAAQFQEAANADPTVPVAVAANLTVTDADSTSFSSATVSITGAFKVAEDSLAFTNAAGMGDIAGSYSASTGVLTLTSAGGATAAQFQAALRAVTYSNSSDTPNGSDRTLTFRISDGTDLSAAATRVLRVEWADDTPSGADKTVSVDEDADHVFAAADFGFTDIDGGTLRGVTVTTLPDAGGLTLDGVAVTAGDVVVRADIDAGKLVYRGPADGFGDSLAHFTFQVMDQLGSDYAGQGVDQSPNTITFNVTAVNDAPVIGHTGLVSAYVEGASPVSVSPNATVSDVDSASLTSATVSITNNFQAGQDTLGFTNAAGMSEITGSYNAATGVLTLSDSDGATAAEWQAALRAVTFANSSETLGSTVRQVSFTVSDGTTTSAVAARGLSTAGVNDAPSGADKTLHMEEESEYRVTAADLGFSDIDGHTLAGVKITTLPAGGTLSYDGSPVTAGEVVVLGPGHDLIYQPAHDGEGVGYDSFTFQVKDSGNTSFDGVNLDPTPNTITVDVDPLNDAPVGVNSTLNVDQDAPRVLRAADFTFTDVEGDALASVKITTLPTHGTLTFDGAPATAGVTVTAADLAAGKLVFTPAAGQSGAAYATLTFQVQDDGGTAFDQIDTDGSPNTLTIDVAEAPPEPTPTPPSTPTVDGVPVTTTTGTGADGEPSHTVVIPVVQPGRTDSVGGNNVADIPVVTSGGATLLSVQAPAGYGLTVSGPAAPQTAGTSLTDLIREIQAHTATGSADQTTLTGGGSGFLGSLTSSTPLLVQTVVPTGGGAGAAPLVINGTAAAGDAMTALVIDTRGLPSGSTLQLNNVDFAAVVGAVTVTGGAGSQHVYGDGASQTLFLGADDDELHGGGGTDTVASAGGADRLYGDEGADSVSGGIGDDLVHGNAGSDTVSGGEGHDVAYGGKDNDRVTGDGGSDLMFGDLGDDFLQGNAGADTLDGGAGNDTVHGGQDADQVTG
ncbi:MAG: cadherin-like domain-containing protein, partial [Phenylobacterium sp.]